MIQQTTLKEDVTVGLKALSIVNKKCPDLMTYKIPAVISQYRDIASKIINLNPSLLDDENLYSGIETRHERKNVLNLSMRQQQCYAATFNKDIKDRVDGISHKANEDVSKTEIINFLATHPLDNGFEGLVYKNSLSPKPAPLKDKKTLSLYLPYIAQEIVKNYKGGVADRYNYDEAGVYHMISFISYAHPININRGDSGCIAYWKNTLEFFLDKGGSEDDDDVVTKKPVSPPTLACV